MTAQHKYFVIGLLAGMIALYVWHRRTGAAGG